MAGSITTRFSVSILSLLLVATRIQHLTRSAAECPPSAPVQVFGIARTRSSHYSKRAHGSVTQVFTARDADEHWALLPPVCRKARYAPRGTPGGMALDLR